METLRFESPVYPRLTAPQLWGAITGAACVYWHDHKMELRLRGDDLDAFYRALRTGYVVGSKNRWRLFNAYFHWCELGGRPYVRVRRLGPRYAEVCVDMIGCPYRLDDGQVGAIRQLLADAMVGRGRRAPLIGAVFCSCRRVALELADETAAEVYAVAMARLSPGSAGLGSGPGRQNDASDF